MPIARKRYAWDVDICNKNNENDPKKRNFAKIKIVMEQ
jgi:hypothetical protein